MNEDRTLATLADILLPPPPDWHSFWLFTAITLAVLALVIAALFLYIRKSRLRTRAASNSPLHELANIEKQWRDGVLPTRETAYRLATVLRVGMGIQQLTRQPPVAFASQSSRWETLIRALEQIRYAPHNSTLDTQWFDWTREWLASLERPRG